MDEREKTVVGVTAHKAEDRTPAATHELDEKASHRQRDRLQSVMMS